VGLREALAIDEASLNDRIALMTPGELDLCFFRGPDLRAKVTTLSSGFVRWDGWPFDARLREPQRLADWLSDRGIRPRVD
jgi:hypothetical protein